MRYVYLPFLTLISLYSISFGQTESAIPLLQDLATVEKINRHLQDHPPLLYNTSMMGGYFNMPSARMNTAGTVAIGAAFPPPYQIYGLNIQPFDRIELSANYLIYHGIIEPGFGKEGYGDDAERMGNIKLGILTPTEDLPFLPLLSIGAQDFIGTQRFNAQYIVATKVFSHHTLECSLGWGHGRIRGFFGAMAWYPLHHKNTLFKNISIQAEYDANDYKKNPGEHPNGRSVKSHINIGISLLAWDTWQMSIHSVRGEKIAISSSLRYPLGTTSGFVPKVNNPSLYRTPINTEPLGNSRPEKELAQELAYALCDQGLDLYRAYLQATPSKTTLFLSIVNNRYRDPNEVRIRIQHVLSALLPPNIEETTVVVEATALPCLSYHFRTQDLYRYREHVIGEQEIAALASMQNPCTPPSEYDSQLLFQRSQPIWTLTFRPQLTTFFGNTSGKFKYNISATVSPEGYLFDTYYYKALISYSLFSNTKGMTGVDRLNPSHMFVVRSDSMKYFQTNTLHLAQAYIQRSWSLNRGWFYRLAAGYFEVAYAGGATELLFYPIPSSWAVGISTAVVWKRTYEGLGFFHKVRKFDGTKVEYLPFTGWQCFLHLYYDYQPLSMDFAITAGRFLAKDLGGRFEVGRYFPSGMRFSLWYAATNANEKLNGHKYHDKGFSFLIPLDFFLKKSSRNYIGYAMAAWLRDQAAQASTGKKLYPTLREERYPL